MQRNPLHFIRSFSQNRTQENWGNQNSYNYSGTFSFIEEILWINVDDKDGGDSGGNKCRYEYLYLHIIHLLTYNDKHFFW